MTVPCFGGRAQTAEELVDSLMIYVSELEAQRGEAIDWLSRLPAGQDDYSSRDVVNAIGKALTAAGVQNNLVRE